MNYTKLPGTTINVSNICLGTMTFGQQNSESEAHSQIDYAVENGINFIDTAEMYPVAAREKTYGETEKIIGAWFKKTGKRNEIVLASKVAGPNRGLPYIREDLRYNRETIMLSVEKSLARLQTDYIDLYQLHWPARKSNMFGQLGFTIQEDEWQDNFQEILETLRELITEGKVRAIGVSNETPWGIMRYVEESRKNNLPKISTVQNPYSLLNRSFEVGLAETVYRENIGLLAYSPLGFGTLSGKYLSGERLPESRLHLFPNFTRYNSEQSKHAIKLYADLARENDLHLVELALAFIRQQSFVTSTIIGATTLEQLKQNINTHSVILSDEILKSINTIQQIHPNPAP